MTENYASDGNAFEAEAVARDSEYVSFPRRGRSDSGDFAEDGVIPESLKSVWSTFGSSAAAGASTSRRISAAIFGSAEDGLRDSSHDELEESTGGGSSAGGGGDGIGDIVPSGMRTHNAVRRISTAIRAVAGVGRIGRGPYEAAAAEEIHDDDGTAAEESVEISDRKQSKMGSEVKEAPSRQKLTSGVVLLTCDRGPNNRLEADASGERESVAGGVVLEEAWAKLDGEQEYPLHLSPTHRCGSGEDVDDCIVIPVISGRFRRGFLKCFAESGYYKARCQRVIVLFLLVAVLLAMSVAFVIKGAMGEWRTYLPGWIKNKDEEMSDSGDEAGFPPAPPLNLADLCAPSSSEKSRKECAAICSEAECCFVPWWYPTSCQWRDKGRLEDVANEYCDTFKAVCVELEEEDDDSRRAARTRRWK